MRRHRRRHTGRARRSLSSPSKDEHEQRAVVEALRDPARFPHPVERVEHRETHSSHVLLAGDYAYKIKKPLNLGFLDYSSLELRHHYCHEELRLNERLAPFYLDVVAITGSAPDPRIGGFGEVIEWAVKMRRFDEDHQLDRRLAAGMVTPKTIDALSERIAAFHGTAPAAEAQSDYGAPAEVARPMRENFEQTAPQLAGKDDRRMLDRLRCWTEERLAALKPALQRRRADGRVRECHGDMHLANMIACDRGVAIFDGIEFDASLRWIDVANDIAFAAMDLDRTGAPALAGRLLDRWLANSGDYDAIGVLRLYLVYRAMVRAKTTSIRLGQESASEAGALRAQLRGYLALAERYSAAQAPAIVLTHGVAGTGKSTAAAALVERIGAVRIRADIERRRLYPGPDPALRYSAAAHDAVYAHLQALAVRILDAGFPVVVDAAFLERDRRVAFARLAAARGVPYRILDLQVPLPTIERRIDARRRAGSDPSEADRAVMLRHRERREALTADERAAAIAVDNGGDAPRVPITDLPHARGMGTDG